MARVLIVGGGCRGIGLARALVADEQAVRITTRSEEGRAAIEQAGAECWIGDPDRLATMRGALDRVTVLCWMLAGASGGEAQLSALFGERLEFFMTQAIDTTVRGVVYERGEDEEGRMGELLGGGEAIVRRLAELNRIPFQILTAGPGDAGWQEQALGAIGRILGEPS